jgi:hypothetical protein
MRSARALFPYRVSAQVCMRLCSLRMRFPKPARLIVRSTGTISISSLYYMSSTQT